VFFEVESGITYALTHKTVKQFEQLENVEIDQITGFSTEGRQVYLWDSAPQLRNFANPTERMEPSFSTTNGDLAFTHLNALFWVPSSKASHFDVNLPQGGFLVSDAAFWSLALIDRASGNVVWSFQDSDREARNLHSGQLLESGNILYFKNLMGKNLQEQDQWFSEVIEIDPRTKHQVWSYRAKENKTFYANAHGSVERLANGNTLIAHKANGGGAFEVTPGGRVVWDWQNSASEPVLRADLFRVRRVPKNLVDKIIAKAKTLDEIERSSYFRL
jgi:hypothetical protein